MFSLAHMLAMPFASLALLNLFPKKEKPMSLIERLAFPKKISEVKEKIEAKIKKLAERCVVLETEAAKEKASQAERAAKVVELEKKYAEMSEAWKKDHADYVNASTKGDTPVAAIEEWSKRLNLAEKPLIELRQQIEALSAPPPLECSGGLFGTLGRVQRAPSTEAQIKQIEHEAQKLEIVLRNLEGGPMHAGWFSDDMMPIVATSRFYGDNGRDGAALPEYTPVIALTTDDLAYLGF